MSFTRISLYPHELKTIADLTVELTRIDIRDEEGKGRVADIGPEIFGKLVQILYGPIPMIAKPQSQSWMEQMEAMAPGHSGGVIRGGHL